MRKRGKNSCQKTDFEFRIPQSAIRDPQSNGFTLIEIVITIVLVSILASLAAVIILQGVRAYSDEDSRSDVHYQTRIAVERAARELRSMQSCSTLAVTSNPTGTISFIDINTGLTVTFSVSGTNLRRISTTTDLLASGITSTQPFSLISTDGTTRTTACPGIWFIDISVTDAKGTQSLPIRTRVHPRNF
jgi:prepilin-type N-terminal cleavage/methylation domain-containing protein